jgi:hypothetical protein
MAGGVAHPVVGLERLAAGDAQFGEVAVVGAVVSEGRLVVDQLGEDLPIGQVVLARHGVEPVRDLAVEVRSDGSGCRKPG